MLYGISIIMVSIIAISSLLLGRQPNAVELLKAVGPYQYRIGILFTGIGACQGINWYLTLIKTGSDLYLWAVTVFVTCVLQICLGLLLAWPLIQNKFRIYSFSKMHVDLVGLAYRQGVTGIAAMVWGVWVIIASFIYAVD